MMTSAAAIAALLSCLDGELVVAANGSLSREAFAARDRARNFYMIGSMGLAAAIGLGLALARPERQVVVVDGDGNLLMGLGVLPMIAERAPASLVHVAFDNQAYATTGGQRSVTDIVDLAAVAEAAGYPHVRRVDDQDALAAALRHLLLVEGPAFLLAKVAPVPAGELPPRVPHAPTEVADRFRSAVHADRAPAEDVGARG